MKKVKVLMFVDRLGLIGGIQTLLLNLQSNFDKNKFEIEYLFLDDGKDYSKKEQLFVNEGAILHKLNGMWINSPLDFPKYAKTLDNFFKNHHDYAVVHVHSSSKNYYVLKYAKKYGIKKRIIHAHNSGFTSNSVIKKIVGDALKIQIKKYATDYFACSDVAAEWLFGKNNSAVIIKNGIDLSKYNYNEKTRKEIRNELGVSSECYLVGNVGRFVHQKNHEFQIEIAEEVIKINSNYKFVFIGIGELMPIIKEKVKSLSLEDNVLFLGFRDDVNHIIQGVDLFLMPSFIEGFPVTGVEAQASGCPCLFSDTITREAKILNETEYKSLDDSALSWAKEIIRITNINYDRKLAYSKLKEKGFDIKDTVKFLEKFYIS